MKRFSRLTMILLLLFAEHCFAISANVAFQKKHACVPADRSQQCTVIPGDTLSGFSFVLRGNGRSYKDIQAASFIKNADLIYPGMVVVIPDVPTSEEHSIAAVKTTPAQTSATGTFTSPALANLNKVLAIDTTTDVIQDVQIEEIAIATSSLVDLPTTSPKAVMATNKKSYPTSHSVAVPLAYTYVVNGNLDGALETQLLLYANEDEKRAGKNEQRIELKDSLAIPSKDGKTIIFIRSGKIPAQPFNFVVAGVGQPIDGTTAVPYAGKIPKQHSTIGTIGTNARALGKAALFSGGNPYSIAASYAAPKILGFIARHREIAAEKKALAKQVIHDKANLELYRALVAMAETKAKLEKTFHQEVSQ